MNRIEVIQIDPVRHRLGIYKNAATAIREIQKLFPEKKIDQQHVSQCIAGKRKTHQRLVWRRTGTVHD